MRNNEMVGLQQALGDLVTERLPVATAMKVRKIVRVLGPHLEDMEEEKKKIVSAYTVLDASGSPVIENNQYTFESKDKQESFLSEMHELMMLEWESPERLYASELGAIAITPATLIGLGDLLYDSDSAELE